MPRSGRQQFIGLAAPGRPRAVLERIVFGIDAALRRWNSVVEFTTDPACILRIRLDRLERPLVLADGTCARAGERFVDLHLWNEQIPSMPKEGASIAWARHMHVCFLRSLQQLVRYLAARPDLDDIAVVRCTLMFASCERDEQMVRLLGRYGFELAQGVDAPNFSERARRFGENIQISLIVLTRNKAALRRDTLRRGRTRMFMSRRALEQRYGGTRRVEPSARPDWGVHSQTRGPNVCFCGEPGTPGQSCRPSTRKRCTKLVRYLLWFLTVASIYHPARKRPLAPGN